MALAFARGLARALLAASASVTSWRVLLCACLASAGRPVLTGRALRPRSAIALGAHETFRAVADQILTPELS